MPTDQRIYRERYLSTGFFEEKQGYVVDRPAGCHDWLLIHTVRGSGRFCYAGGTFSTESHEAVLIAPGTPHRYEVHPSSEHWDLLWAHFLPPTQWLAWLRWPSPATGWGRLRVNGKSQRAQVVRRLQEMVSLSSGYRYHREALALNSLESVLLLCHEQAVVEKEKSLDSRIVTVLDHVCRNLTSPLAIDQLARVCHLSPSRFAHLFREQMQMTPQQFIEQQRLDRARELLEHTDYAVGTIAKEIGFASPFYFSRRFKNATGESPRDYRQRFGGA